MGVPEIHIVHIRPIFALGLQARLKCCFRRFAKVTIATSILDYAECAEGLVFWSLLMIGTLTSMPHPSLR
jgi:hypothetical protein